MMKWWEKQRVRRLVAAAGVAIVCGCSTPEPSPSVGSAWERRGRIVSEPAREYRERNSVSAGPLGVRGEADAAIATVNGRPISRRLLMDMLIRSRGAGVLEQLVGLETASAAVARLALRVTETDVERERELSLRRLSDPLSSITPGAFDREAAERLLDAVLAGKNMSRDEFEIVTRRNAHLRKIVESQQSFTEVQLQAEFRRVYGRRAVVRHIQLGTPADVERVRALLDSGERFDTLAGRYSANTASASQGGLLEPFWAGDEALPGAFRDAAFSLAPGEVSSAVRIGQWYHLIRLDEILPAERHDLAAVQGKLERSLSERETEPAMFALFEKLFREATIEIHDPVLAEMFSRNRRDRGR